MFECGFSWIYVLFSVSLSCVFGRCVLCFLFVFSWIYALFLIQCKRHDKWEGERASYLTIPLWLLNCLQSFLTAKQSFILRNFVKNSIRKLLKPKKPC
ncbi:hypothetical protein AtNW77_Chr1g0037501 [Arabidopsis thaliana]